MNIDFIILAAGKGTRMGGDSPKVLADLAGRPMIQHLLDTVETFPKAKTSVIVGYKSKEVQESVICSKNISFINLFIVFSLCSFVSRCITLYP